MNTNSKRYIGSCHCGAVQFAANIDLSDGGSRCNCSICTKLNAFGKLMKPEAFELLAGEGELGAYEWGPRISKRYFCKHCGVQCFGRGHLPEVGGDYVSINLSCLDGVELSDLKAIYWDGRHDNWQAGPRATPWPILPSS
ncbi:MAG TPA: GFA family protein [Polyangiaceae bacterium]|nr:GFA family protein [Polyangiaceae bacterium]